MRTPRPLLQLLGTAVCLVQALCVRCRLMACKRGMPSDRTDGPPACPWPHGRRPPRAAASAKGTCLRAAQAALPACPWPPGRGPPRLAAFRSMEGQRSSRKGGSPAGPSWLQSSGKLRPPASPSLRDSIRGLDGRTPATKHCEPVGVCIKDEVVSLRNASEMMFLDLVGVRHIVEGDVEVI